MMLMVNLPLHEVRGGPSGSEDKYQSLETERMATRDLTMILLQATVGTLGNFCLFYHYIIIYFTKCKLRSTDLILRHLTVAKSFFIISRGIPEIIAAFAWKNFLNYFGCKFVFYIHRVGKGVSISSTSLLSIFQVTTISPRNSRCTSASPSSCAGSCTCCLISFFLPIGAIRTSQRRLFSITFVHHYKTTGSLHAVLSFPDVVSLGLMIWASSSTVFILYRHKQQVQHIHGNNISARSSPETRVTQTILVLVRTFLSFYTLSPTLSIFVAVSNDPVGLVNISTLIAVCFPTVSPFVLMSRDSSVSRLC
uniref:Vomeronasal type-1 receptor n=1 Tax=Loxodonta africana TaxID=9785 RepID=G3UIH5_LOXAF